MALSEMCHSGMLTMVRETDSSIRTICLFCSPSSSSGRRRVNCHNQETTLWAKDRATRFLNPLTNLLTTTRLSRPKKTQSFCSIALRSRTIRTTSRLPCLRHRLSCHHSRHTMLVNLAPVRTISSRTEQDTSHRSTLKSQLNTIAQIISNISTNSNTSSNTSSVLCLPHSNRLSCHTTA